MTADGLCLQVQFNWRKDRQCHSIHLLVGDRTIRLLESLEGTDVEEWPESPPLQQLSVEELRPSTHVALLVGMAGQSHWSMSVEPAGVEAGYTFDVACRSRAKARQLGSGYRLQSAGLVGVGNHAATVGIEGRELTIMCDHEGPAASQIQVSPDGIRIEPKTIVSAGTTRWRYTVGIN